MPVRWNDDETVSADAVRLVPALDQPDYDCVYLALASTEHGECVLTLANYARTR